MNAPARIPRDKAGQFLGNQHPAQKKRQDVEGGIQRTFVAWCRLSLPDDVLWFSVPNENNGTARYGARLKALGRRAGVADFAVVYRGKYHALEFKAPTGSTSKEQAEMAENTRRAGSPYAIARSLDEAKACLKAWGIPSNDITAKDTQ